MKGASIAVYADPGYILFHREGTLYARPFDVKKLDFTTDKEISLKIENVVMDKYVTWAAFGASQNGLLVYRSAEGQNLSQFVWLDPNGKELEYIGIPENYDADFDLHPEGNKIVVGKRKPFTSDYDIWQIDLANDVPRQLTKDELFDRSPRWSSPNGEYISFQSYRDGIENLFKIKASSINKREILIEWPDHILTHSWSADGKYIFYSTSDNNEGDIYYSQLQSGGKESTRAISIPGFQHYPELSPNGKWLAFQSSDEFGTIEIYVTSFPDNNWTETVSKGGGLRPRWKNDSSELFYSTPDGKFRAVKISEKSGKDGIAFEDRDLFSKNVRIELFSTPYLPTPDGSRILYLKPLAEIGCVPINLVFNWTTLLDQ